MTVTYEMVRSANEELLKEVSKVTADWTAVRHENEEIVYKLKCISSEMSDVERLNKNLRGRNHELIREVEVGHTRWQEQERWLSELRAKVVENDGHILRLEATQHEMGLRLKAAECALEEKSQSEAAVVAQFTSFLVRARVGTRASGNRCLST